MNDQIAQIGALAFVLLLAREGISYARFYVQARGDSDRRERDRRQNGGGYPAQMMAIPYNEQLARTVYDNQKTMSEVLVDLRRLCDEVHQSNKSLAEHAKQTNDWIVRYTQHEFERGRKAD